MVPHPFTSPAGDFYPVLARLRSDHEQGMQMRHAIIEAQRHVLVRTRRHAELIKQHLTASHAQLEFSVQILAFLEARFWPRVERD